MYTVLEEYADSYLIKSRADSVVRLHQIHRWQIQKEFKICQGFLGLWHACLLPSRRGLVQEDKRMAFVYTHGLFIT